MLNGDSREYFHFTRPARLDKAIHSLEGLLKGITADRTVNDCEVRLLKEWMYEHREFADRHPFNDLFPVIARALTDNSLDEEEVQDILWLCGKMRTEDTFYDDITSDIQRLHAIVAAIAADSVITMEELDTLSDWIEEHKHLRTCWPYDEIESLILQVQKDKLIDAQEHALLMAFFSEFGSIREHRSVSANVDASPSLITGLCSVCPQVMFSNKAFCFTGQSKKASRKELALTISALGGRFSAGMTKEVDYLIIGADGNPCWAFACYGRKVETAIKQRKSGSRVLLVHEHDFWDAVQEAKS